MKKATAPADHFPMKKKNAKRPGTPPVPETAGRPSEEMDLARTRLHEILSEVAMNNWKPWDAACTLARLMTPDAIRGLAEEQRESNEERGAK